MDAKVHNYPIADGSTATRHLVPRMWSKGPALGIAIFRKCAPRSDEKTVPKGTQMRNKCVLWGVGGAP